MKKTKVDAWQRRIPGQRHPGRVDRVHGEKRDGGETQNRCQNRDQVGVDLEPAEETPDGFALQRPRADDADRKPNDEGDDAEKRHVVAKDMEQRFLKQSEIHCR